MLFDNYLYAEGDHYNWTVFHPFRPSKAGVVSTFHPSFSNDSSAFGNSGLCLASVALLQCMKLSEWMLHTC